MTSKASQRSERQVNEHMVQESQLPVVLEQQQQAQLGGQFPMGGAQFRHVDEAPTMLHATYQP